MDIFGLLILAVFAVPLLAVVSIVMSVGTRDRIKRLELRIAGLEAKLAGVAGELPVPEPAPAASPASTGITQIVQGRG